jgi:hypothetical protein
VKLDASHNLTETELVAALAGIAASSGIEEELQKAIRKKTAQACDDAPKEPRHPAMQHLYRQFLQQFREANRDIERYVREIAAGEGAR